MSPTARPMWLKRVDEQIALEELPHFVVNRSHRIIAANRAFEALFSPDVIGRCCWEVTHGCKGPCAGEGVLCPAARVWTTTQPFRSLHTHRTASGLEHHEIISKPVETDTRRTPAVVHMILALDPRRLWLGPDRNERVVGWSPVFNRVLGAAARAARSDAAVLVRGEIGTGRRLLARVIHHLGARSGRPLVVVDCATTSNERLEADLVRAASRPEAGSAGESPLRGTVLLTRIDEATPELQHRLLKLIRSGDGDRPLVDDLRVLSVTDRDLLELTLRGEFREELYYRCSPIVIDVPPLRERMTDLEPLAEEILRRIDPRERVDVGRDALDLLRRHRYPGNITELGNVLARARLVAGGRPIGAAHIWFG